MGRVFPFILKRKKQYGIFAFTLTLALFGLAVYLTFWVHWPLAFVVTWVAMVANFFMSIPNVLDSRREVWMKRLNTLIQLVGCTIVFYYNVLIHDGKIFLITWPFEEIGLGNTILLGGSALFYLFCLLAGLDVWRTHKRNMRNVKRSAVKMVGPDGKQYLMPGDAETGWAIERERADIDLTHSEGTVEIALLDQRMADLMFEEFQRGKYELSEKPINGIDDKNWGKGKTFDPEKLWADYAYGFHSRTAKYLEAQGLYDKAKEYMDRGTAILLKRGGYINRYTIMDSKELREKVYSHFPDTARDRAVEKAYSQLLNNAYAKQAQVEQEMREYEAGAAKRRLEREDRYFEEEEHQLKQQMRAEKEQKLRAEYEAKMRSLDDRERAVNALLDKNTYTNEENYLAGNLGTQEYSRRKFLRDEKAGKYRKAYEDALGALDDEEK